MIIELKNFKAKSEQSSHQHPESQLYAFGLHLEEPFPRLMSLISVLLCKFLTTVNVSLSNMARFCLPLNITSKQSHCMYFGISLQQYYIWDIHLAADGYTLVIFIVTLNLTVDRPCALYLFYLWWIYVMISVWGDSGNFFMTLHAHEQVFL